MRVSFEGGNFAIQSWPRASTASNAISPSAAILAEESLGGVRNDFPTAQLSRFRVKLEAAQASAMRLKMAMGDRYRVHAISSDDPAYCPEDKTSPEEALSELRATMVVRWKTSVEAQANSNSEAVNFLTSA